MTTLTIGDGHWQVKGFTETKWNGSSGNGFLDNRTTNMEQSVALSCILTVNGMIMTVTHFFLQSASRP